MSTKRTYKGLLVSLGLLPLLITLVGLHFFPATLMLGIGLGIGITAILLNIIYLKDINFFLLVGSISIGLYFLFRLFTGYEYIPDKCNTPVLELLMFTFCFIYLTLPDYYRKFHMAIHLRSKRNYTLEAGIIVVLSAIHLIILAILQEQNLLDNPRVFLVAVYLVPILIYLFCITVNIIGINMAAREEGFYNIIRIAPLWNGKIYLCPHTDVNNWKTVWDVPVEEWLEDPFRNLEHYSTLLGRKIVRKGSMTPRFILRYRQSPAPHSLQTVHLYILPLKTEQELSLKKGRFFDFEELRTGEILLSDFLQEELEHLDLAASMWKEFY